MGPRLGRDATEHGTANYKSQQAAGRPREGGRSSPEEASTAGYLLLLGLMLLLGAGGLGLQTRLPPVHPLLGSGVYARALFPELQPHSASPTNWVTGAGAGHGWHLMDPRC